jgi:hypothetical protein
VKTYLMIAALGLATAACGGGNEVKQTAQNDAAMEQPELMASSAAPGGVVPGGAVDVLQREGWRIDPGVQQADAAPAAGNGQPG